MPEAELDVTDSGTWPELLTTRQAALVLQVTPHTVRAMLDEGTLGGIRLGSRTQRISKSSLLAA